MQYTFSTRRDFLRNAVMLAGAGVTAPLMAAMKYDRDAVMRYFRQHAAMAESRVAEGIEASRKADATLVFKDAQGRPCETVHAKVRQKRHDFKSRFAAAFNLATLPFYWKSVEPERGKTRYAKDAPYIYRRPPIDLCLEFCEAHGIEPKAHCLNYADWQPAWARGTVEREKALLEKRFAELAARYAKRIPMWEVTNETLFWGPTQHRNSVFFGKRDFVEWSFKTAAKYFPSNKLVINEAAPNVIDCYRATRSAYYMQIENALMKGCRIDGIGIQAHAVWGTNMKRVASQARFEYNPEHMFRIMDTYAQLGKPLQITELTIPAYSEDPGDEAVQAEIVRNLYSIWFSHPSMEAIIYWDLSDAYSWTAEHVGSLCRRDMSPKPAYNVICDLFGREWRTNFERDVGGGRLSFRGFRGTYEVEATSNGRTVRREFHVGDKNPETVVLV